MPTYITPPHLLPSKILAECQWNYPGINPFQGSKFHAILSSPGLSTKEQIFLATSYVFGPHKKAIIHSSSIQAEGYYILPEISHMNFGKGLLCSSVSWNWPPEHTESATLITIPFSNKATLIPDICNNVSVVIAIPSPQIQEKGTPLNPAQISEPSFLALVLLASLIAIFATRIFSNKGNPDIMPWYKKLLCYFLGHKYQAYSVRTSEDSKTSTVKMYCTCCHHEAISSYKYD